MSNKKNETSYPHNNKEIIADEFGRTDAPNWIVDDWRYFTGEKRLKSIYKKVFTDYVASKTIYKNKEVLRREYETHRRLIIFNEILRIDNANLLKCPYYIKYKRHLRSLTINRLKYICHYFFAWQSTPCRATSSDWKAIQKDIKNEKYVECIYKILGI
jgi:hypothetical protein